MTTLADALGNCAAFGIPVVIYAIVVRWRAGIGGRELGRRLALRVGPARYYGIAVAAMIPSLVFTYLMSSKMAFEGSMLKPYIDAPPSFELISSAVIYGFVATGFPEELLFRGLIAGALFRRLSFWRANMVQALIFVVPHALILLVAPQLWPVLFFILALALTLGWLRHHAGSIGPPMILHAAGNVAGALMVLDWGR